MVNSKKITKNHRILGIYVRLCQGKIINKRDEADKYDVDERSIQRDIDDIRAFLAEQATLGIADVRGVEYNRSQKGFLMTGNEEKFLNNGEILAITMILLESRAFTKKEIVSILDKVAAKCVSHKNRKMVEALIANEQFHYVELSSISFIQEKIWNIGTAIRSSSLMKISYHKQAEDNCLVERMIEPLAIMFSEYYFYLIANIVRLDEESGIIQQIHQYPAVFRIDRIQFYKIMDVKFKIPYSDRFQEGEFRKRVQFMYPGELIKIQFKYIGKSPEAVLDRLPTAQIIKQVDGEYIIEAEVYGKGVVMWLLSQGEAVELLKPVSMREQIITTLTGMISRYK
jgi:predicted DNA-binding transcriptional regulator YafY